VDLGETLLAKMASECENEANSEKPKREGNKITMYLKPKSEK
jgi:translation initiation factor IF-3